MELVDLNKRQIEELHSVYYENYKSLSGTIRWLKKRHGIDVNRHQLSDFFRHEHNLPVHPPNGRQDEFYRPINKWLSPETRLVGEIFQEVIKDIRKYQAGKKIPIIDYLSACAFIGGSTFMEAGLYTLMGGAREEFILEEIPAFGFIDIADIQEANELYEDIITYWVFE